MGCLAEQPIAILASLPGAVPAETALPVANSFLCECQQFGDIPDELLDNDLRERVADVA